MYLLRNLISKIKKNNILAAKDATSFAEIMVCMAILAAIFAFGAATFFGSNKYPGITGYFIDLKKVGACTQWKVDGTCNWEHKPKIYISNQFQYTDSAGNKHNCKPINDVSGLIKLTQEGADLDGCYVLTDDINFEKAEVTTKSNLKEKVSLADAAAKCGSEYNCPLPAAAYGTWQGIGNRGKAFSGIFLGNGKILYNLNAEHGLFNNIDASATVQDFGIHDSHLTVINNIDPNGFLTARVTGNDTLNIRNIYVKDSKVENGEENNSVGGLIGRSESKLNIALSYNQGIIEGAGGLVGEATRSITFDSCQNLGSVTANNDAVGGFLGTMNPRLLKEDKAVIILSRNDKGKINQEGAAGVAGGFIGDATNVEIQKSWVNTDVKAQNSSEGTGGFIGRIAFSSGTLRVEDSYALGNFEALDKVGGFVGSNTAATTLSHVYSLAECNATDGSAAQFAILDGNKPITYTVSGAFYGGSTDIKKDSGDTITTDEEKSKVGSENLEYNAKLNKYPTDQFQSAGFDSDTWTFKYYRPTLKENEEYVILPKNELANCVKSDFCDDNEVAANFSTACLNSICELHYDPILKDWLYIKRTKSKNICLWKDISACKVHGSDPDPTDPPKGNQVDCSNLALAAEMCQNNNTNYCACKCDTGNNAADFGEPGATQVFCLKNSAITNDTSCDITNPNCLNDKNSYKGEVQFAKNLPAGIYKIWLYGAASHYYNGGFTYGNLTTTAPSSNLMLVVPSSPSNYKMHKNGNMSGPAIGRGGGGGADVRYLPDTPKSTNISDYKLASRILVAGGAGNKEMGLGGTSNNGISIDADWENDYNCGDSSVKKSDGCAKSNFDVNTHHPFAGAGGGCKFGFGLGGRPGESLGMIDDDIYFYGGAALYYDSHKESQGSGGFGGGGGGCNGAGGGYGGGTLISNYATGGGGYIDPIITDGGGADGVRPIYAKEITIDSENDTTIIQTPNSQLNHGMIIIQRIE